ncbi:MAG: FKBP-type peptidyl-prolyl cis-trans isomerase [Gammaproteobacteria bacterium]
MKLSIYLPAIIVYFLSVPVHAEALNLEDETTRINYSLGHQIGGDFKRQGVEMKAEAVVQGIRDALSGAQPQMSPVEMKDTLMQLKRKVVADQRKHKVERELEQLKEGKEFLAQNAKKEGVVTTGSGLQYQVIEAGSGKTPGPKDTVTLHYRMTMIDGEEYSNSYKKNEPATFQVDRALRGWSEGLQLMKEGGKFRFYIPQHLAYRNRGPLAHRTLITDIELIKVETETAQPPNPEANKPEPDSTAKE